MSLGACDGCRLLIMMDFVHLRPVACPYCRITLRIVSRDEARQELRRWKREPGSPPEPAAYDEERGDCCASV